MRGLKNFTFDEIALIAEMEEAEMQSILDSFMQEGKLDFDGEIYKIIAPQNFSNKVVLNMLSQTSSSDRTFSDVCCEFLSAIQGQKSPVTFKSYKSIICGYFIPYFGRFSIQKIGIEEIENFTMQDFMQRLSKRTVGNALTLLGSIFKHANQQGYISKNPYLGIENTKSKNPCPARIFSEDELKIIFANSNEELKLFAKLILTTGIKKQEILSLKTDNIDPIVGIIKIEHNHFDGRIIPSNFRREIKVGEHLQSLMYWLEVNSKTSPATINKRLKKEFAKLGLKQAKMDDLRNNFCVEFLKTGTFFDLAKQLGMQSTESLIKKYGEFL